MYITWKIADINTRPIRHIFKLASTSTIFDFFMREHSSRRIFHGVRLSFLFVDISNQQTVGNDAKRYMGFMKAKAKP